MKVVFGLMSISFLQDMIKKYVLWRAYFFEKCKKEVDKTKMKETFGITIPYWTESLKKCISNLKNQ